MSCAPRPYRRPSASPRRERMLHAFHADRIDVAAEHQRRSGRGALEHADHVRAGRAPPPASRRRAPRAASRLRQTSAAAASPGGARHERRIHRVRGDEICRREGDPWTADRRIQRVDATSNLSVRDSPLCYVMPALEPGLVVAITGASAGIGRACAERLGARRRVRRAVGTARRSSRRGRRGDRRRRAAARSRCPATSRTPLTWTRSSRARSTTFGRLDVMICNAGIGFHGTLDGIAPDDLETARGRQRPRHDLRGARGAPRVHAPGSPATSSRCRPSRARAASAGMSVYRATKAAQIGFIEGLRTEFLGTGVHASVVYPGLHADRVSRRHAQRLRSRGEGRGPRRQPVDVVVNAIVELHRTAARRGLSVLAVALAARAQRIWRRRMTDRVMRRFSRRQPHVPPMSPDTPDQPGALALQDRPGDGHRRGRARAGGRALLVGGWVRDELLGRTPKDLDMEVFGSRRRGARGAARRLRARGHRRRKLRGLQDRRPSTSSLPRAASPRRAAATKGSRSTATVAVDRGGGPAARLHDQRDLARPADRRDPRSVRRPRGSGATGACASSIRRRSATTACACCARCSSPRGST